MNDFAGIDENKLKAAVKILKETLGREEAEKMERLMESKGGFEGHTFSEKEMKMIKTVIENPEMLRMILSTKQAREGLGKFLKDM